MQIINLTNLNGSTNKSNARTNKQLNFNAKTNMTAISDTVSFGMNSKSEQVLPKTKELLVKVLEKLNQKNQKRSQGYANAVRNDKEVLKYYDNNCENLITTINELFSQSPDGKIVTFKNVSQNGKSDEYLLEGLTPNKNIYNSTTINIVGDKVSAKSGEKLELGAIAQNSEEIKINSAQEIEQLNETAQGFLNSFLSKENTNF